MSRSSNGVLTTLFLVVGLVLVCHGSASATVGSLNYLTEYQATEKVKVFRGHEANIIVLGNFVDLATKAEVHTTGGALVSSIRAELVNRAPARVTVDVTFPSSADLGTYEIWLRYVVEVAGPDKFKVRLFNHGKVNSITASPSTLKLGEAVTFTVSGEHLGNVKYDSRGEGSHFTGFQVVEQTTSVFKFKVTFVKTGTFSVAADQFYDKDLSEDPFNLGSRTTCYEGEGFSSTVHINPITQPGVVTPSAHNGDIVQIRGQNLKPEGYAVRVQFLRAGATAYEIATFDATGSQTQIGFLFKPEMDRAPIRLLYFNTHTSTSDLTVNVPGTVARIP